MSANMASAKTGGWLQWKGSNVCIDLTCKVCGQDAHEDGEFLYFWHCPNCAQWWRLEPEIMLTAVQDDHDFNTGRPNPPENAALYTVQDLWNGDVKLTREQRMWIRQALDAQMDADPT